MYDAIKHVADDNFVFQQETALCTQHSPIAASINSRLPFSWAMDPTAQS